MTSVSETVDGYFAAVARGDANGALEFVAEEVVWGGAGDPSIPWIGERHTRADVANFLALLGENLETRRAEVVHRFIDGEDAMVITNIDQVVKRTGRAFTSAIAFHIKVRDGLIVHYRYYEDSLALARAYGAV